MSTVTVRFLLDGQPRPPDVGSVTYTLYGQAGEELVVNEAVTTGPTTTSVNIVPPAQTDQRTFRFEKRTMIVSWTVGGVPQSQRVTYRLTAFLNHTVTPEQVRSYLGVKDRELSDSEIDLVGAFLEAETRLGQTPLEQALASGGIIEQRANDVILYLAALRVIPSLKLRVAQEERDGAIGFSRPIIRDFSEIQELTEGRLEEAISAIDTTSVGDDVILIVAGTPTDIITGA